MCNPHLNMQTGYPFQLKETLDVRVSWTEDDATLGSPKGSRHNSNLALKEGCYRMRTIDLSPLYRSAVGFDRMAALLETAATSEAPGYPPYNIARTDENAYRIELAVAGFRPEELSIEVKENRLAISGRKAANDEVKTYLHRGLAERNFERRFQLADYVVVTDADLADGLLTVSLKRELPEALKPRRVQINTATQPSLIPAEQAA